MSWKEQLDKAIASIKEAAGSEQARDMAQKKLAAVIDGADPSAERHAIRQGFTVSALCDWYLTEAEAGRLIGRNRRPIKASSLSGDRSRIALHIKPLIGNRVVSQLKLADIERLQGDIAAGRTARARRRIEARPQRRRSWR